MNGSALRARGALALAALALAGVAGFLLAGQPANGATKLKGTVALRATKIGSILVNSKGRTLYLFEKDKGGKSSCSGMCATYWPPLISASKPTAGAGVKAALLGRVKRSDGRWQVTYNKHPLYLFAEDKAPGQLTGQDTNAFGADWYAVNAKGVKVTKTVETTTSSTTDTTTTGTDTTPTRTQPGY